MKRVGYWVTRKKFEKIDFGKFQRLCEDEGVKMEEVKVEEDLETQGPFDLIIHRASDLVAEERGGDTEARALLDKMALYLDRHPETVLLDPIPSVTIISHRIEMSQLFRAKIASENIHVPRFTCAEKWEEALMRIEEADLSYPLIAKPVLAHDHNLMLIMKKEGVKKLTSLTPPLLIQEYVPHDGILYKISVIGERVTVITRPSLKNLSGEEKSKKKSIRFHTHKVSKPESQTDLNASLPALQGVRLPELVILRQIVQRVSRHTGLSLFGVDLILESGTRKHHIIDINYFPGFEGVKSVPEKLRDLVLTHISHNTTHLHPHSSTQVNI